MKKFKFFLLSLGMVGIVGCGNMQAKPIEEQPVIIAERRTLRENPETSAETPVLSASNESDVISTEELSESAETAVSSVDEKGVIETAKEAVDYVGEWLAQWLSPATITSLTAIVSLLGALLYVTNEFKKLSRNKEMNAEEICKKTVEALEKAGVDTTNKAIADVLKPIQDNINKLNPVLNYFAKILALSQENTPEAKVAILNLIQEMGNVETEVVDDVKKNIVVEVQKTEEIKKENDAVLDEIIGTESSGEGRY